MVDVYGLGFSFVAALSIAATALCVRMGTNRGNPNTAVVVSLAVNVVVVLPAVGIIYYPDYGVTPLSLLAFIGAGVTGTMLGRVLYFAAIDRIGASRADPIKASMPLFASILSVSVLGEVLTPTHLLGIVLIVGGVAVISWESARGRSRTAGADSMWDLAIPFAAAFFFGFEPTLAKIGVAEGTPAQVGLVIKVVAASIGFLAYLWWRDGLPTRADLMGISRGWYLAAGLANTSFMVTYYAALAVSPVVLVVPIIQTSPLFVLLLSFVFIQRLERVTWRLAAGAAVVVAGTVAVAVTG